jgi:nitroreductase
LPPSSTTYPKAGFADAPAAIAVACTDGNQFAAGLACGNMLLAARAIGYGVKIVAGGVSALNTPENKTLLGVPDNMAIIAILIVGNPDTSIDITADGVTGASTRKPLSEISTIVE